MKQKIFALLLSMIFVVGMIPARAFAAEMTSEIIIAPQYEDAKGFNDGYAAVKKDGKWGYIDEEGNVVVDFKYDWAGIFNDGVAVTATMEELTYYPGESYSYYEKAYVAHLIDANGMDVVLTDSSMDGFFELPEGYDAYPIYARVNEETGTVYPDTAAEMESTWFCSNGVVLVDGYVFRKDGTQILLKSFDGLYEPENWGWDFSYFDYYFATGHCMNGMIPMYAGVMGMGDGYSQCFYMDTDGNIVKTFTPANWDTGVGINRVCAPDEGLILAEQLHEPAEDIWGAYYTRYGVMDQAGNWVIDPVYTNYYIYLSGSVFNDGMLPLADENGLWGVYDTTGRQVVAHRYAWINVYSQGYAAAQLPEGNCVYLDTQGNTYQIGGINGGIANVSICSAFNSDGVAAVYDLDTGTAYCILNQPVNGVFPAIKGSDLIDPSVYFPDYDGTGTPSYLSNVANIVVMEQNGLYGYLRLNLKAQVNPFSDVSEGAFYYDPVLWALDENITSGVTATTFNPGGDCLRAQVVTFLWRAAGQPEPTSSANPFVDVKSTDFYYKAVLWAVENGITNGADATHFNPMGVCNRAQVVTFLYRAFRSPAVESSDNPFTDVTSGIWYALPVLWAVENGITNGLNATEFGPNTNCNRAQIVTFLYRAYK